jgi:hypothetical protein
MFGNFLNGKEDILTSFRIESVMTLFEKMFEIG